MMRGHQLCRYWFLPLIALLTSLSASAQQPAAPQPYAYTVAESEAAPPSYIHTGRTRCVLVWAPGQYKADQPLWRFRTLNAANLSPSLEITVKLDDGMELAQSEEAADGQGVFMLFRGRQRSRQLLLMYLRFADGTTEAERYTLPFDFEMEQLLISPLGAYVRGISDANAILFYLNPETRQATVLPFGPDKGTRLTGCGIEGRTGRLWLSLVRLGNEPGPVPSLVRLYTYGQLIQELPIEGLSAAHSPATLYLASDTVGGLWIGTWGRRGSEYGQGPLVLAGLKARLPLVRFVDSLGFFSYLPPRKAERTQARLGRRKNVYLANRFYHHKPVPLATGGYRLAAERYYVRTTSGPSPFFTPMSPYYGTTRAYETTFVVQTDFDSTGRVRRLQSTALPSQVYAVLEQRAIALPDRPVICLIGNAPQIALPDPDDARRTEWQVLQATALGIAANQQITVERLIEDGPTAYAFGEGKDAATGKRYFFLSRLPEGVR